MSDVTIRLGGRKYTVACGPGEEAHIAALGDMIDGRLTQVPNLSAQSESRMLLFASLLMADELQEARKSAPAPSPEPAPADDTPKDDEIAETLENLAEKLEALASRLEDGAGSS